MKYKEIAVIGLSARFAGVTNKNDFREVLRKKKSMIGEPSRDRLDLMKQKYDDNYVECGYLENIDAFDNAFFDITKREARLMSPQQRICLEMAAEAVLDAGYSLESVKGTNCGVYIADGESDYNSYIDKQSSSSIIGSMGFMLSGQIGYHLDLHGENLTVNSGCSSSLLAIHTACEKLTLSEIDMALVGGIILEVKVPKAKKNTYDILGIMSDDYKIHSFDEKANGTVSGEGGGFVLLKSLEQAIKDGDHIYGVLVSGAVNGDGGRCTNVSMPSVEAQGNVVCKAWSDADIDKLTEVEAHGIGAPVGDAVEAQSLIDAVKKNGLEKNNVKVSSVKSNIGHLFTLSGMASLIKTMIGYENNETYPIASLEKVNPLIKFEEANLDPLQEIYHWKPEKERMTGISAFGLSGCNAHIVVKNHIATKGNNNVPAILKLSAKSKEAFYQWKADIIESIERYPENVANLVYTMNVGRDDYSFRTAIYANNTTAIKNALERANPVENEGKDYQIIYAIKSETEAEGFLETIKAIIPDVARYRKMVTGVSNIDDVLALYYALREIGISGKVKLFDKYMAAAIKCYEGKCTLEELDSLKKELVIDEDYSGFIKEIERRAKDKETIVVDFSRHGNIIMEESDGLKVFHVQNPDDLAGLIKYWYEAGQTVDWEKMYSKEEYTRISAPLYPFQRKRFWIEKKNPEELIVTKNEQVEKKDTEVKTVPSKIVFLLSSENINDVDIHKYPYNNADFRKEFHPETGSISMDSQLAMLKVLANDGIIPNTVLADKKGKAVYSYSKGHIRKKRLLDEADGAEMLEQKTVISYVKKVAGDTPVTLIDFSWNNSLSDSSLPGNIHIVNAFNEESINKYLQNPYYYANEDDVADYVQEPKVTVSGVNIKVDIGDTPKKTAAPKTKEVAEAEAFLEKTWAKAFNLEGAIGHDEDFFALGGNSLIMQAMSSEINDYFGKKFDIFEIYDYETIEKLAVRILEDE